MISSFLPALTQNPIIRAEFHHQRFVIRNGRVGTLWIALAAALVIPALILSVVFTAAGLAALFIPDALNIIPYVDNSNVFVLVFGLLLTMMVAMYAVVTLVTLGLSSNSISREKQGNTWDNLRLTDIGAARIVLGKWWASLRALNGDIVMMTVIRVGFVALYLTSLAPALDILEAASNGTVSALVFVRSAEYLPALPVFILLTLVYGALDAGLTAALGIISALPDDAAGSVIGSMAMALRLITAISAAAWFLLSLETLRTGDIGQVLVLSVIGVGAYITLTLAALWAARQLVG